MRSVCIVGLSPSSRDRVFKEPLETKMWCLNNGHLCFDKEQLKRFTHWFQIHPRSDYEANHEPQFGHAEWLKACGIPVYMEQTWPDIPTSTRYPRQEIVDALGYDYFTSTMSYMVALAIYQGYEEIRIYGIDMAAESEYFHERPCLEFWLGVAHNKGILLVMPEDCPILKGRAYGQTVNIPTTMINKFLRYSELMKETRRAEYQVELGKVNMLEELLQTRPDDKALEVLLAERRFAMVQKSAEFNSHAGAVQVLTDVVIEALRPENEEAKRLRAMSGELLNPGYVPIKPGKNGLVPSLVG